MLGGREARESCLSRTGRISLFNPRRECLDEKAGNRTRLPDLVVIRLEHGILPPTPHGLLCELPTYTATGEPDDLVQIRPAGRLRITRPVLGEGVSVDKLEVGVSSTQEVQGRG